MAESKTDIKQKKKDAVVEYFTEVPIYRYAAMYVGIDEETLARWRKEDAVFEERLHREKARWVNSKVKKAKVEFALERMEKEIFGQKITAELNVNPIEVLLRKYDLKEGGNDRQDDEPIPSSSEGTA